MKTIMFAILFITACLAAILTGFYTYIGSMGTLSGREASIARGKFLMDPAFSYKHQYLTEDDLESAPDLAVRGFVIGSWKTLLAF